MSKLINKEALRQSLIKVKQYIDDKLFGNSESLKDLISEEISKGLSTIVDSAPETLDTLKEVAEYITKDEQHAVEVTTTLSKHASDIQSLQTDNVIIKGDAENSAVLKGGDNQVISEFGIALGKDNIVGLKGWYYKAVQRGNDNKIVYLYLTTKQQTPMIVSTAFAVENQEKTIEVNLSKGDICSIINGDRQIDNFEFRLNEMSSYGRISFTYKGKGTNPLYTINDVDELKLEDYSVFCISKPSCGIVDLSKCNVALGNNTKSLAESSVSIGLRSTAVGITSYAEGENTIAEGNRSHAEGNTTKALGESSHAEGYNTIAEGVSSHAEGKTTTAEGNYSHAEGHWTTAKGIGSHAEGNETTASGYSSHAEGTTTSAFGFSSHAEGQGTITDKTAEHAEGKYNKSNTGTIHSVGIGTSDTDRKNAHEIMQDGKHYVYGIGGYDGTNPSSSNDLAKTIEKLQERLKYSSLSINVGNIYTFVTSVNDKSIEEASSYPLTITYGDGIEDTIDLYDYVNLLDRFRNVRIEYDGGGKLFGYLTMVTYEKQGDNTTQSFGGHIDVTETQPILKISIVDSWVNVTLREI